jgi:hypothetical protein
MATVMAATAFAAAAFVPTAAAASMSESRDVRAAAERHHQNYAVH